MFKIDDYKLCYIEDNFAYFTTQELSEQWGDDWNDAPYELNAGRPYEYSDYDRKNGKPEWYITKLAFDKVLSTPDYNQSNSGYSVKQINRGDVAWLRPYPYASNNVVIHAGTCIRDFIDKIEKAGGKVYATEDVWHKLACKEPSH